MTPSAIDQDIDLELQDEQIKPEKLGPLLGVRLRLIFLILLTQLVFLWWVADSEIVVGIYLLCYSLMMPTALYLLFVRVFKKWLPFNDKELILGYIVLTATLPIVGFGGLRFISGGMGFLRFMTETQPQWVKYIPFLSHLPILHNPDAIRGMYVGSSVIPLQAWTIPIIFWSAYLLLVSAIWISLAGILRRVWIQQERLTFPIAMLPLQMMDTRDDIFRKRIFWLGFAIPVILQSMLAVQYLWLPSLPAIQLKAYDIKPLLFNAPPWNALPDVRISFYPMAVGLAYFLPSDVSFSCWFFAIASRLVYVAAAVMGIEATGTGASRFPYQEEQGAGAWIAFAFLIIWGARHHLKSVVKNVPESERAALTRLALLAGLCMLLCAGMMIAVGIPMIMACLIVVVYVAYVITGARVRAEAGGIWIFSPLFSTPHRVANSILTTNGLGGQGLVAGAHFDLVHVDIRGQSLPYLMEGMDVAEKTGIPWRTVLTWVAIGTVTALAIGWWSSLSKYYAVGLSTAKANPYTVMKVMRPFDEIDRLTQVGGVRDTQGIGAMAFAACVTILLAWTRRAGFLPFHPVGYVLCNTLTMNSFILPVLLAWLAKTVVLRFGGHKTYRASVPFFVGIVLGDVCIQAGWSLFGQITRLPIYQFLS